MIEMPFYPGDPAEGDPQLDLLNRIGCLPEVCSISSEFGKLIDSLDWPLRKRLDELFGEVQVSCIEAAYAVGVAASRLPPVVINEN